MEENAADKLDSEDELLGGKSSEGAGRRMAVSPSKESQIGEIRTLEDTRRKPRAGHHRRGGGKTEKRYEEKGLGGQHLGLEHGRDGGRESRVPTAPS